MGIPDRQLLDLQIDALFTHDPDGRIRAINEPGGGPAPRFFFGRTRAGNRWRVRHDLPGDVARRLDALAAAEPIADDLQAEPRNLAGFLATLREVGEVQSVWSGPAYRFPDALPPPGDTTRLALADLSLLRQLGWNAETEAREFAAREPYLAVIADGGAVSVCFSARLTARAAEAGVETLATHRGRGHAPAVVAAWVRAVRATGRIPLYSTSWDNAASRAVARKLGLIMYGADLSLA